MQTYLGSQSIPWNQYDLKICFLNLPESQVFSSIQNCPRTIFFCNFDAFERKTDDIYDRDHDVTYQYYAGTTLGTMTKTLYNLIEPLDYTTSIDQNASQISYGFNQWITGYLGKLTDENIENEWSNTTLPSGSVIIESSGEISSTMTKSNGQ